MNDDDIDAFIDTKVFAGLPLPEVAASKCELFASLASDVEVLFLEVLCLAFLRGIGCQTQPALVGLMYSYITEHPLHYDAQCAP